MKTEDAARIHFEAIGLPWPPRKELTPLQKATYTRMAEAINKEVEPLRALVRDLIKFQDHLFAFYCMESGEDDEVEAQLNALIERSKALLGEVVNEA